MYSAVTDWFTWIIAQIPYFLLSHPVIDILGLAVAVWVIALVARLLRLRF